MEERETQLKDLGLHTKVLLQLNLKDPEKWDVETIVSRLFDKFENLDLEDEIQEG